jgi:hypothetical protein
MLRFPPGTKMFARVLVHWDIPTCPIERGRVKKLVIRTEPLFMDDMQGIQKGEADKMVIAGDKVLASLEIEALSRSFRLPGDPHNFHGQNKMHPFLISFQWRRKKVLQADKKKAQLIAQGFMCHLDHRSCSASQLVWKNMFFEIPELNDAWLCKSCYNWWHTAPQPERDEALACRTLQELAAIRSRHVIGMSDVDAEYCIFEDCELCQEPFETRPDDRKTGCKGKVNEPHWRMRLTDAQLTRYPVLEQLMIVCFKCYSWVDSIQVGPDVKPAYHDILTPGCTVERLRELRALAASRYCKPTSRAQVDQDEECGLCYVPLRQIQAGETLKSLCASKDPDLLATGFEVDQYLKDRVDAFQTFREKLCCGCRKVIQSRTAPSRSALTTAWGKTTPLADIREVMQKRRRG